ncbi:MAG TPA: hypothetical protein VFV67_05545 [Actinophytocola sp.]|uniref:hypothetical protein n=1 Tax=Actinophytocola sp. TaxID=1872138 RepID=UPI002DBADC33|nr:hypothetical protein [Actinophytocola sp.]HEU5470098.1 hypothetical protein [Actinophytocola sp.]
MADHHAAPDTATHQQPPTRGAVPVAWIAMGKRNPADQVGQRIGLLLAALLAALSLLSIAAGPVPAGAGERDAGVAAGTSGPHATAPSGSSIRPIAMPIVPRTSNPAELVPFATLPHTVASAVLVRSGPCQHTLPSALHPAMRPAEGDRAPPSGSRIV